MGWSDRCSSHRLSLPGRPDLFVHSGEFAPDEILPAVLWSGSPLQHFLLIVSSVVTAGFFFSLCHLMPDNRGTMAQRSLLHCALVRDKEESLSCATTMWPLLSTTVMQRLALFSITVSCAEHESGMKLGLQISITLAINYSIEYSNHSSSHWINHTLRQQNVVINVNKQVHTRGGVSTL